MEKVFLTDYKEILRFAPDQKDVFDMYEEPFLFAVNGEVVVVGEIELGRRVAYIKNMNSIQRNKGYGRMFIQYLFNELQYVEVTGEAVADAVPFWHKMGARFSKIEFDRYISTQNDEGMLIPFWITLATIVKPSA